MARKVSILQTTECLNYSSLNWPSTMVLPRSKAERSRVGCTTVACSKAVSKPAKKDWVTSSLRASIVLVAFSSLCAISFFKFSISANNLFLSISSASLWVGCSLFWGSPSLCTTPTSSWTFVLQTLGNLQLCRQPSKPRQMLDWITSRSRDREGLHLEQIAWLCLWE